MWKEPLRCSQARITLSKITKHFCIVLTMRRQGHCSASQTQGIGSPGHRVRDVPWLAIFTLWILWFIPFWKLAFLNGLRAASSEAFDVFWYHYTLNPHRSVNSFAGWWGGCGGASEMLDPVWNQWDLRTWDHALFCLPFLISQGKLKSIPSILVPHLKS